MGDPVERPDLTFGEAYVSALRTGRLAFPKKFHLTLPHPRNLTYLVRGSRVKFSEVRCSDSLPLPY
jgi:hypothetical protein